MDLKVHGIRCDGHQPNPHITTRQVQTSPPPEVVHKSAPTTTNCKTLQIQYKIVQIVVNGGERKVGLNPTITTILF